MNICLRVTWSLSKLYVLEKICENQLLHLSKTYDNIASAGRIPELAKGIRL